MAVCMVAWEETTVWVEEEMVALVPKVREGTRGTAEGMLAMVDSVLAVAVMAQEEGGKHTTHSERPWGSGCPEENYRMLRVTIPMMSRPPGVEISLLARVQTRRPLGGN